MVEGFTSFLSWLVYYLWLQLATLAVLPLAARVFRALPDRGFALARFLGLLLVSYLVWLGGMLGYLQHTRAALVVALAGVGATCWLAWGRELRERPLPRGGIIAFEALFLIALAGGALVRAYNADINGQEKFMDFALMNAFYTAQRLPAEDPWMSGFGVPYYHFGYLVMASASELAGVSAAIGYNLGMALVLALTITMCASLGFNVALVGRHVAARLPAGAFGWGLLAAALVGLIGNLQGVLELLAAQGVGSAEFWRGLGVKGLEPSPAPQGWPPAGFNWFRASRVIPNIQPDGITEFPYFSFLLGDLHPHYLTLPYDLFVLALGLALAAGGRQAFGLPGLAVAALALGSLVAANTWDVPTFWLAFLAASAWTEARQTNRAGWTWQATRRMALPFGLGLVLFLPYFVGYVSQPLGLGLVRERTLLGSLLIVIGPFLAVALVFGLWGLVSGRSQAGLLALQRRFGRRAVLLVAVAAGGVWLLELAAAEWTLALLTGLAALVAPIGGTLAAPRPAGEGPSEQPSVPRAGDGESPPARARAAGMVVARSEPAGAFAPGLGALHITWFLVTYGLLILLGTEVVYIHDSFGTRMNTVFKFHYHAWLLLGLGSALALMLLASSVRARPVGRLVSLSLATAILVSGAVYPLTATVVKSGEFRGAPTLDGARFLARSRPDEYRAIEWLRSRSERRPVVLEAIGPDYQEYARVSTFSGLPTVMGWVGHELQWRGNVPELGSRQRDVEAIYRTGDEIAIRGLLDRYRVEYVFVGSLERSRYGPQVDSRFNRLLEIAFSEGGATVFRVPRAQPLGGAL